MPLLRCLLVAVCSISTACASSRTIRTQRLEIVDPAGRVRGVFAYDAYANQPALTLLDENAEPLAVIALVRHADAAGRVTELQPIIQVLSASGGAQAAMTATDDEGGAVLLSADDTHDLVLEVRKDSIVITKSDESGQDVRAKLILDQGPLRLEPIASDDKKASNVQGRLSPRDLDVLEAVFRYQMEHNASSPGARDCYFLELADKHDPPPALLARFVGSSPPVEPLSAADPELYPSVHHKGKTDHGVILRLRSLSWIDDDTVELDGGYYQASLSSSGNTYRAVRRDGKWVVVSDKMRWIS